MALVLTKLSETSTTITLGWDPPQGVGGYVFYANGQAVSVASANDKNGPRKSIKYSKTSPGPPYIVAATCRQSGILVLQTGMYPSTAPTNVAVSDPTTVVQ
jgi:hypothetical protein